MNGDMKALARKAINQGWTLLPSRSGHVRWISPTGRIVISASTSESRRGILNHRAQLRRAGFVDGCGRDGRRYERPGEIGGTL